MLGSSDRVSNYIQIINRVGVVISCHFSCNQGGEQIYQIGRQRLKITKVAANNIAKR